MLQFFSRKPVPGAGSAKDDKDVKSSTTPLLHRVPDEDGPAHAGRGVATPGAGAGLPASYAALAQRPSSASAGPIDAADARPPVKARGVAPGDAPASAPSRRETKSGPASSRSASAADSAPLSATSVARQAQTVFESLMKGEGLDWSSREADAQPKAARRAQLKALAAQMTSEQRRSLVEKIVEQDLFAPGMDQLDMTAPIDNLCDGLDLQWLRTKWLQVFQSPPQAADESGLFQARVAWGRALAHQGFRNHPDLAGKALRSLAPVDPAPGPAKPTDPNQIQVGIVTLARVLRPDIAASYVKDVLAAAHQKPAQARGAYLREYGFPIVALWNVVAPCGDNIARSLDPQSSERLGQALGIEVPPTLRHDLAMSLVTGACLRDFTPGPEWLEAQRTRPLPDNFNQLDAAVRQAVWSRYTALLVHCADFLPTLSAQADRALELTALDQPALTGDAAHRRQLELRALLFCIKRDALSVQGKR